jgi:putative CocE/NonD family hydrolase
MRYIDVSPREVREIENLWIPLSDGVRLAARAWLPADAETTPVPAIVEYLPYRKRDGTAPRDEIMHPWFARQGYAVLRIDIRGTGESDGRFVDEYIKQEQDDALEALRWIAAQPWCSGKIGMMGISWGGFNSLQIAARHPPELKAIIPACFTDDRYADDVHYMGGCLLGDNATWASAMTCYASPPPDPAIVGERWRSMWLDRLENMPLLAVNWMEHPRRDAFWRQGSVCENYADIECPVFAVGGWLDAYSNAVPRLLANLKVPCKGLVGPWAHTWPHNARPQPAIGFLQECLAWWDQWLKGIDRGAMEGPRYRVWVMDRVVPRAYQEEWPGRWIGEPGWPSPHIESRILHLNDDGLAARPAPERPLLHRSPQYVGSAAGFWCPYANGVDIAFDQREDDARSLCFDTEPLEAAFDIAGAPVVELELDSDKPQTQIAVRLCDVDASGSSLRVSYGVLNLSHRESHVAPTALIPGQRYRIHVQLNDVGYRFLSSHRLRIAVSTAYWPTIWPQAEAATITLYSGSSRLLLPVRARRAEDNQLPEFGPAEGAMPGPLAWIRKHDAKLTLSYDPGLDEATYAVNKDEGVYRLEAIGLETGAHLTERYRIQGNDPLSARADYAWVASLARGDWHTRTKGRTAIIADARDFHLTLELDGYEGDKPVFNKRWERKIPRDLG